MEKRLRSSLQTSAEEFLATATKLGYTKSTKTSLKSLIHGRKSSSPLVSSLPLFLRRSISDSVNRFKTLSESNPNVSPKSPPTKRLRRSSRNRGNDDTGSSASENARQSVVEGLQVYAHISLLCITHPKSVFSASDFLIGASELHDNLVLFESHSELLSEIANLCEEWWKNDLEGKETLVSQSLPFLLSRSLTLRKKVEVHRVYSLREALLLLDFEDESIEDLKHLLLRCLISPLYLKTEEGRKFLAFIFTLSTQLGKEGLAMIKSQIPFGRKSILEAYGEIVFRTWKAVEGDSRDEIENTFLQALVEGAIHASSGAFAASVRRVLGEFIMQRTTNGVEKLLFRLSEPVIFRSLQAANSNVRQNALHLMLDLFPVEDPEATKEVKDTLLERQFFLLEKLFMDECPEVRVIAVEGGCRILHRFWEVIPSSTITKLLTKIFDCMTHDSCTEVRISTVNGIVYLLGNPYSHEVLKVLLPRLRHLINDCALSVRAAVVDLLLVLAEIQTFHFHKVVPLDSLLSALADDHQLVGQKITKLLIPTYFPSVVTPKEACNRFVALIRRYPAAGARFCEFVLSEGAPLGFVKELLDDLINLATSPVRLGTELIDAVLSAASHLCDNLVSDPSCKAALKEKTSLEKLKCLFSIAVTPRSQSSVCKIVVAISPDTVDGLFNECMGLIMNCSNLCSNDDRQDEVRSAHRVILTCGWFDNMFEAMARHLQKTAQRMHTRFDIAPPKPGNTSKRQRKTRDSAKISKSGVMETRRTSEIFKARFDQDYALATGIAWQIKDLLSSEDTCKAILRCKYLETAFLGLKVLSEVGIMQSMRCDSMSVHLVVAYSSLVIHMSLSNVSIRGVKSLDCAEREWLSSSSSHESFSQARLMDVVIDHLLYHVNKLLTACECGNCGELLSECVQKTQKGHCCNRMDAELQTDRCSSQNSGSIPAEENMKPNSLRMLTAVLKFIVDATTMELVHQCQESLLNFTQDYLKFIISSLTKYSSNQQQSNDDESTTVFLCLRSSVTYAAKLFSILLRTSSETSSILQAPYSVSSLLFDIIALVEVHLSYRLATRLVSAVKPWMPDLILAFGHRKLLKEAPETGAFSVPPELCETAFPLWLTTLAKTELYELQRDSSNEETGQVSNSQRLSAIKKLVEMTVQMLRSNPQVIDAVGAFFLDVLLLGLEKKDFDVVLGLVHFVTLKLVLHVENWKELKLMSASIQVIYVRIEAAAEEQNSSREGRKGREKLESAKTLLESVWLQHFSGEQGEMGE